LAEIESIFEQIDPDEEATAIAEAEAELDAGEGNTARENQRMAAQTRQG
jgi:hypothetical protein